MILNNSNNCVALPVLELIRRPGSKLTDTRLCLSSISIKGMSHYCPVIIIFFLRLILLLIIGMYVVGYVDLSTGALETKRGSQSPQSQSYRWS